MGPLSATRTISFVLGRRFYASVRNVRRNASGDGFDAASAAEVQRKISTTMTRIRDAEGDVDHATLLSLAMQLSLESEIVSAATSAETTDLSKATWTLQSIKAMAEHARRSFARAVADRQHETDLDHEELVKRYPTLLIDSINHVLFEYHGYSKMKSWGDSDAFSFARVVENGTGSPLAIAILYKAVASETGLHLDCIVLEDGNYAVLSMGMWAIDPYSKGLLMSADEVSELFDLELPLKASTLREVSIALVKQQLFLEWGEITDVFEPAFRLPLDGEEGLDLALGLFEDVSFSYGTNESEGEEISPFFIVGDERGQQCLANCVRAAEKLRFLDFDSRASRIRHAVLLYFNKKYTEAVDVLEGILTDNADDVEDVEDTDDAGSRDEFLKERIIILMNKCRLLASSPSL